MSFVRSELRYAHIHGYTFCKYTENGDKILSCGSDGDVRVYNDFTDDDPFTHCIGDSTLCVIQYNDRMLATTDVNTVQAYTFPDCKRDGTEFQFSGLVTCIKVNKKYIAACSEDMLIKIIHINKEEEPFQLHGHEGIILRIDLSPKGFLASSSGDGTIKIWNLDDKNLVKTIKGFGIVKSINQAKFFYSPTFEPVNGDYLAYPKNKDIFVLKTEKWDTIFKLHNSEISSDYTTCEFSPCGKYIAAGTIEGEISIWELKTHKSIKGDIKMKSVGRIISISWNPKNNGEIVYCDSIGQMGFIYNCYGKSEKIKYEQAKSISNKNDDGNEKLEDLYVGDIEFHDDINQSEDEDNENCIDLGKLKHDYTINGKHKNGVFNVENESRPDSRITEIEMVKAFSQQPAFQPGSTSVNLDNRFMVWNRIGMVRSYKEEGSIDLLCHDASIHCGLHMKNHLNHTMASLSTTALALACETPSKLVCIVFGASSGSREWSISMNDDEQILAIAASDKIVAITTDLRLLRIFGVMGTQREVISIPGSVVSMSAFENKIIVVYHSAPSTEDQHMNLMFIQLNGYSLRSRDIQIPLTRCSRLEWIGFTDLGSPVIYESSGLIKMYSLTSNVWFPICNTTDHQKGVSDSFFIIEISEIYQLVRAVLCRGSNFPLTNPIPLVGEYPMKLPMCELDSKDLERFENEEKLVRLCNFNIENSEKSIKESAIKLFAIACQSEMEARAREIIEMLNIPEVIALAIKYSNRHGRMHLTEKLQELLAKSEKEKEEKKDDFVMELTEPINTPTSENKILKPKKKQEPTITPKSISLSNTPSVRNPFKRSTPSTQPKYNPLSHLTDNVIGYAHEDSDLNDGIKSIQEIQSQDLFESQEISENIISIDKTKPTTPMNFMIWFNLHKDELKNEYKECSTDDLTKYAMKRYKTLNLNSPNQNIKNNKAKRKLEDTESIDNNKSKKISSGITRLAKFNFTEN